MNLDELGNLVELAEQIQSDAISNEDAHRALVAWDRSDGATAEMVHFLYHFIADADLRARDATYQYDQRAHLDSLLINLRNLVSNKPTQRS